jgi:hypothetical protein
VGTNVQFSAANYAVTLLPVKQVEILRRRPQVMRNSVKLSTLSVPALVIIAAAGSCFAQTQVTEKPAASPNTVTMTGAELSLALNRTQPVNVERMSSTESSEVTKTQTLTAATFTANRNSSLDVNRFFAEELKNSANLDGLPSKAGKSRIEFVPSRGQKLPDDDQK